jgi:hypothetical protein
MMAYTAVIVVSFIVLRKWALRINMIMVYAVIPGVLLKLFMDFSG